MLVKAPTNTFAMILGVDWRGFAQVWCKFRSVYRRSRSKSSSRPRSTVRVVGICSSESSCLCSGHLQRSVVTMSVINSFTTFDIVLGEDAGGPGTASATLAVHHVRQALFS